MLRHRFLIYSVVKEHQHENMFWLSHVSEIYCIYNILVQVNKSILINIQDYVHIYTPRCWHYCPLWGLPFSMELQLYLLILLPHQTWEHRDLGFGLDSLLKRKTSAHAGNQTLPFKVPGQDHDKSDDSIVHCSQRGLGWGWKTTNCCCPVGVRTISRVVRSKIWPWVPRDSESRTTVLARPSSNLPDRPTDRPTAQSSRRKINPYPCRKEGHILKYINVFKIINIWSWVQAGNENKNDCAGEGQQQITALLSHLPCSNHHNNHWWYTQRESLEPRTQLHIDTTDPSRIIHCIIIISIDHISDMICQ
jgi:hypothetical protein